MVMGETKAVCKKKIVKNCQTLVEELNNEFEDFYKKFSECFQQTIETVLKAKALEARDIDELCRLAGGDKYLQPLHEFAEFYEKVLNHIYHDLLRNTRMVLRELKETYQLLERVKEEELEKQIVVEFKDVLERVKQLRSCVLKTKVSTL